MLSALLHKALSRVLALIFSEQTMLLLPFLSLHFSSISFCPLLRALCASSLSPAWESQAHHSLLDWVPFCTAPSHFKCLYDVLGTRGLNLLRKILFCCCLLNFLSPMMFSP